MESENQEVVDMVEAIGEGVVKHEEGVARLLAAFREHSMPKNECG